MYNILKFICWTQRFGTFIKKQCQLHDIINSQDLNVLQWTRTQTFRPE